MAGLVWFLIITLVAILFYYRRKKRMSLLERNGIPGPLPHLIWGNMKEYFATRNVLWDTELIKKYGPICGYYLGAKPIILVGDPSLIDKIQTKHCKDFLQRPRLVPGGINPDPKRAAMLGNLNVHGWEPLRRTLDKGFSPTKLKSMLPDVQSLIGIFMSCIAPNGQNDFYSLYQNLTLDLIGKTGFGINSDIQQNPNDQLKAAVQQEFSKSTGTFILKIYLCFPEFQWLIHPIRVGLEKVKNLLGIGGHSQLWELGSSTVKERLFEYPKKSHSDLLTTMLESEKQKLSETDIIANSVLFFEAGFETLSASLGFITYLLMKNVDVQENIRKEIIAVLGEEGKIRRLEQFKDFPYLDAVIKESLRIYPPQTTFIGRSGTGDLSHTYTWSGEQRHCTIPKGVHIQIALYQILNSPSIWKDPSHFDPQRFINPEDDELGLQKIAFQPFGRGRRMCIGMKYADMVLKTALITLLSKYRITFSKNMNENAALKDNEIEVVYKTATMTPKNGVTGRVELDDLFKQN